MDPETASPGGGPVNESVREPPGAAAGCPPVRWLAEEFRNIQSGAAVGE